MKWGWIKYVILPVLVIGAFVSYETVVWRNLALDHFFSKRVSVHEYGELKIVENVNEVGLHKKVVTDLFYKYDGESNFKYLDTPRGEKADMTLLQFSGYDYLLVRKVPMTISGDPSLYVYPKIFILEPGNQEHLTLLILNNDPAAEFSREDGDKSPHIVHCYFKLRADRISEPSRKRQEKLRQEQWQAYLDKKMEEPAFVEGLSSVFDYLNVDKSCLDGN